MQRPYLFIISLGLILLGSVGCSKDIQFSSSFKDGILSVDPIEEVEIPPVSENDGDPQTPDQPTPPDQPTTPDPIVEVPDENVPPYGDDYQQPVFITDTFEQTVSRTGKMDLLIVIDNSDSMFMDYTYRSILNRMSGFFSTLNGVDYQIAFTTTDVDANHSGKPGFSGDIERIITPSTPNKEAVFASALDRQDTVNCRLHMGPNCGSNDEQPLKAAMMAAEKRYTTNMGFFRDDADLVVLVISDEEELSTTGHTVTPAEALQSLRSNLGSQKSIRFYGSIIQPGDSSCYNTQRRQEIFGAGAAYGYTVATMTSMTGGRTVSICDSNYTNSGLSAIASSVSIPASTETVFTLSADPVEGSVFVTMLPQSDIPYTVSGRTVTFATAPSAGTQISIAFEKQ